MASPKPRWFLLFLFFLCCNIPFISFASDHISFNNSLSGNQTISSQGGKFQLGFFQLGNRSESSNYYLGIWYKKVIELTPVWVANRNTPISDPNKSELRILATGNLALLNHNTQICSNETATHLWQSMDHPTDTWLPGAKLGRGKATGQQRMVSRKNSDDPAEGIFSLEIDPNGSSQYLLYWNRSKPYWTSGQWNGKIFTNVPEMNSNYLYDFKYVSNENETYFTYSLQDDSIISSMNCSVWFGNLLNLHQETDGSGKTLFLRLSASELKNGDHMEKDIIWVIIGSVIERLGRGAFGSVFKGTLPNSRYVAVKRLEGPLQVGEKQFRNEVSTIGIVQHVNLVRLRGLCCERNKRLLVYDYMENGSLDKKLFYGSSTILDWKTRYQIALGAARGLAYLHESCIDCIIHCDVKPENILLDELFVPKVADFGMAKLVGREFSRVLTTLRGTIGYLAPEWISGVAISAKTDVYSYGMVLLELVSGRRNSEQQEEGHVDYFPLRAAIELNEGNILALLDSRLNGDANLEEVERVCRVACWCIQDEEHNRPTMGQVVQILEGILDVGLPPVPRSLKALKEDTTSLVFLREHSLGEQSCPVGTSDS
ncbi:Serine/threonine-protein kinase [Rhynchospora pubera]|uniref:non-specific serine/threonine protein kinase n=1 Tax=Rhynchospora pubera TaxID=906938 RepID=A0AAV8G2W4_9POAL|nr:Serine/threonine-protein kinase [Rhynchospora pubera]